MSSSFAGEGGYRWTQLRPSKEGASAGVQKRTIATKNGRSIEVQFRLNQIGTRQVLRPASGSTQKMEQLALHDLPLTSEPGAPAIPFYAVTLPVAAADIVVKEHSGAPVELAIGKVDPAQPEKCRCAPDQTPPFTMDSKAYQGTSAAYRIDRLGDYRGTPVSRVLLFPARYEGLAGKLTVYPEVRFEIQLKGARGPLEMSDLFREPPRSARGEYDYLVVAPSGLYEAVKPWLEWKESRGLRTRFMPAEEAGTTAGKLKEKLQAEYQTHGYAYAVLVGDMNTIPMHRVYTSFDSQTPSDLPNFTMGGAQDIIPDVMAARWVAKTPADVQKHVRKLIEYERGTDNAIGGWSRLIGIASNEGYNPSDNEYVLSIQKAFEDRLGTQATHFYENDSSSNPADFNQAMNQGAMWVTYLGHGDGSSWPSFGRTYSTAHIPGMSNSAQVKPIWIDVACQNGKLVKGGAGERLMNEVAAGGGDIVGVTSYYGGSVNISWHPPAILAQGIAQRVTADEGPGLLGAALQAGHVYLAERWSDANELAYNQRWYHLQGDPALQLRVR